MALIEDAQDSLITGVTLEVVPIEHVENKDPMADAQDPGRIDQQKLLPTSVQSRVLGNLFSSEPESEALGTGLRAETDLPNNSSATALFTVEDNQGRTIVAVPDVAFYIGDSVEASTHWPTNSFGMGSMPVSVFNDWGNTNNKNVATRATIRNATGATQHIIIICRFRVIANPGPSVGTS